MATTEAMKKHKHKHHKAHKESESKESLAQFPDMPKDKSFKAKVAASNNDATPTLSDIGLGNTKVANAKSLAQAETKEPEAMPPFTSGLIKAGKFLGVLGKNAFDLGASNNENNPKAKSLIGTEVDDVSTVAHKEADAAFEKAKGAAQKSVQAAKLVQKKAK